MLGTMGHTQSAQIRSFHLQMYISMPVYILLINTDYIMLTDNLHEKYKIAILQTNSLCVVLPVLNSCALGPSYLVFFCPKIYIAV